MPDKPTTAAGYGPDQVARVHATCLYVATKLGDLMDEITIVGGLVPTLLIDQDRLPDEIPRHVGTLDLDVGFALGLLDSGRYQEVADRLRRAGFEPDVNDEGRRTNQRWKIDAGGKVAVDFLIARASEADVPGRLRNLEKDFAAVITPGLHLAFSDRVRRTLAGKTIVGESASREAWICGAGPFVVLKALAFDGRGENKDAYDLYYVIRNFGSGIGDVATAVRPHLPDPDASRALEVLRRDFTAHEGVGPKRVAMFLTGASDDAVQADVVGFVSRFLDACGRGGS